MRKIYHLSSCKTNQRIIKELDLDNHGFEFQDIKEKNITAEELDKFAESVGSYEEIFSRRAMKYRTLGLNEMKLTEQDYRKYMIEEYTFLKRPFIIIDGERYVGALKKTVEEIKSRL